MRRFLLIVLLLVAPGMAQAVAAQRVVTLAPYLAELVCDAGGCAKLVGVGAYSKFPPQVAALPQVGDSFAVNLEAVLALKPDLVLAWDGGTPPERVERLRKLGLRVEWIKVAKLEDVGAALETLGGWLGTQSAARAAASTYRQRLAALRAQHRDDAPIRFVYQIETAPAYVINGQSPISQALAVCGGVNVFADLPHLAEPVGAEAMLAAAPEAVLFGGDQFAPAMLAYWLRLPSAPAAKRGNLFALHGNLIESQTPRLLDGIEEVCSCFDEARRRRTAH